jgi:hypothetical protein
LIQIRGLSQLCWQQFFVPYLSFGKKSALSFTHTIAFRYYEWFQILLKRIFVPDGRIQSGLDSDFRKEFSQQNTLMMIDKAGLDVISTETFLPVQDIYICKLRHWGQSSATASI